MTLSNIPAIPPERKQEIRSLCKQYLEKQSQLLALKIKIFKLQEEAKPITESLYAIEQEIMEHAPDLDSIVMVDLGNDPLSDKVYTVSITDEEVTITEGVLI